MRDAYDLIVIGGGHNGLVAAAYLARAGQQVLVLERRDVLGGAASTEPVFPGWRVNTGAADAGMFLPEIITDLELERRGLRLIHSPVVVFAPQPDGRSLTLWRDPQKAQQEIAQFSKADAEKYPAFLLRVQRLADVLAGIMKLTPPSIPHYQVDELLSWARVGLKLKRLPDQEMMEFLRLLPLPVSDFLDGWFETPALKAALGAAGVTGSLQGPQASGTAFMLLYQAIHAGQAAFRASSFVEGGMGRLSEVLADVAREHGAEICTGMGVDQVILDGERARGVRLENGMQISAHAVISSANPRHTFFDLLGAPNLEVRFVREVKNIKFRGSTARVNLALGGLPRFSAGGPHSLIPGDPAHLSGHILICPSLEYLERAYDDAKYGAMSRRPCLDIVIPTLLDPSLAPPGQHLMSINMQYAPYHIKHTHWDAERERLGDRVVETLAEYAPGIPELILDRQVLTPLDLERQYGLAEGCIFHGQMGLDQLLFMRPAAGFGQYRTPIKDLYLCGAGAHPGGGVTGAPGYNAAREVLKDLKASRKR